MNQNALLANQIDECPDSGSANPEPLQHFLVLVEDVLRVKPLEMAIFDPLEKESAAIGFWMQRSTAESGRSSDDDRRIDDPSRRFSRFAGQV